jgi:hypothetical protein
MRERSRTYETRAHQAHVVGGGWCSCVSAPRQRQLSWGREVGRGLRKRTVFRVGPLQRPSASPRFLSGALQRPSATPPRPSPGRSLAVGAFFTAQKCTPRAPSLCSLLLPRTGGDRSAHGWMAMATPPPSPSGGPEAHCTGPRVVSFS